MTGLMSVVLYPTTFLLSVLNTALSKRSLYSLLRISLPCVYRQAYPFWICRSGQSQEFSVVLYLGIVQLNEKDIGLGISQFLPIDREQDDLQKLGTLSPQDLSSHFSWINLRCSSVANFVVSASFFVQALAGFSSILGGRLRWLWIFWHDCFLQCHTKFFKCSHTNICCYTQSSLPLPWFLHTDWVNSNTFIGYTCRAGITNTRKITFP